MLIRDHGTQNHLKKHEKQIDVSNVAIETKTKANFCGETRLRSTLSSSTSRLRYRKFWSPVACNAISQGCAAARHYQ